MKIQSVPPPASLNRCSSSATGHSNRPRLELARASGTEFVLIITAVPVFTCGTVFILSALQYFHYF